MRGRKKLKVAIIRFPGSNCDYDTLRYFQKHDHEAFFVWYTETRLPKTDLIVLPGGFAFGDRSYKKATGAYVMDPGKLALSAPIMKAVHAAAKKGLPMLGICNGFQILVKAGLLPGKLLRNGSDKFFCDFVDCTFEGTSFFKDKPLAGKTLSIPVAHGYGRYVVSKADATKMERSGQVFLRYKGLNPNGSVQNIAGVCNDKKTIFGMMPHPERSPEAARLMKSIETYVG